MTARAPTPGAPASQIARAGRCRPRRGSTGTLPEHEVRAMFDRISGVYDRMNDVMTAGLHHRWRGRAADLAGVGPGARVLDVATGTGDLALELARRVAPGGEVVGADFSPRMLERARQKAAERAIPNVELRFQAADALALPFANASFDAATVGFGVRNFADLERGLRELARVVRPGGHVVVLEISRPTRGVLAGFYGLWFDRIVPLVGRLADDGSAYAYLPCSVRRFASPAELAAGLAESGLERVRWIVTAGGIIALHVGRVPGSPP